MPRELRALLFVSICGFLQIGPLLGQGFGLRPLPPGFVTWQMYGGRGGDVCRVEWYQAGADGTLEPIEAWPIAYRRPIWEANKAQRVQKSKEEVVTFGRRVCTALQGGDPPDVRANAWCGLKHGAWKPVLTTDEPICRAAAKR